MFIRISHGEIGVPPRENTSVERAAGPSILEDVADLHQREELKDIGAIAKKLYEERNTHVHSIWFLTKQEGSTPSARRLKDAKNAEGAIEVEESELIALAGKFRFYEFKTEANNLSSKENRSIPSDVFDPATVKAIIDFSIERLTRLEKRSRQLADMHGADIKA